MTEIMAKFAFGRTPSRSSAETAALYDQDYYNGVTSGYSREGYACDHPNWADWLDLIQVFQPTGVVLDLGCAFGYLIQEARNRGYQAYGFDISSFGLRQLDSVRPYVCQSNVEELPIRSNVAEIVLLYDVLEHLGRPTACLEEAVRLLKKDGLLVGTTPDPVYFDRQEATHFFERPPSFWISVLERLGLTVRFRFSEEPYNFQFVACRSGAAIEKKLAIFNHDHFSLEQELVSSEFLAAVPRAGWGPLAKGYRRLLKRQASIYLLNRNQRPYQAHIKGRVIASPEFSTLRLRLGGYVLKDVHLTSETQTYDFELDDIVIPAGGHHLFFDLFPGGPSVDVGHIEITSHEVKPTYLTPRLPFDLYQRYQGAADIIQIVEPRSVLDVGGCIGDREGHLAVSADFFENVPLVCSTDKRQVDHPSHVPGDALSLPFDRGSFSLVVSLDVLEHIPQESRHQFLHELSRLASDWILIGAPFWSEEVEEAEGQLGRQLLSDHNFLREHRKLGLPKHELMTGFFQTEEGPEILLRMENGYLPSWLEGQALTQLYFSFQDYTVTTSFNQLHNTHRYQVDRRAPCYRYLYLINKRPSRLSTSQISDLKKLTERLPSPERTQDLLSADPKLSGIIHRSLDLLSERSRALNDVQFLANSRIELIQLMEAEKQALVKELQETPLRDLAVRRWKERRRGRS